MIHVIAWIVPLCTHALKSEIWEHVEKLGKIWEYMGVRGMMTTLKKIMEIIIVIIFNLIFVAVGIPIIIYFILGIVINIITMLMYTFGD